MFGVVHSFSLNWFSVLYLKSWGGSVGGVQMSTSVSGVASTYVVVRDNVKSSVEMPTAGNLTVFWTFGSLLGFCLVIQLLTGIILSTHYLASGEGAFWAVIEIVREVLGGWVMRSVHANGASFFFLFLYLHVGRGLYYGSYQYVKTWVVGVFILLLVMAAAFLGYVLVWGQMSFWAATVISSLLSTIPYIGQALVDWLWGGHGVKGPTLQRFFSFHYITPFVVLVLVLLHLVFLHEHESNNPVGGDSRSVRLSFHPYLTLKDFVGLLLMFLIVLVSVFIVPLIFSEPDNYRFGGFKTPEHIKPEWYFLWAYAILRSMPSKLGGVVVLVVAVLLLLGVPFFEPREVRGVFRWCEGKKVLFWFIVMVFLLLSWLGSRPAEEPYSSVSKLVVSMYYSFFFLRWWLELDY